MNILEHLLKYLQSAVFKLYYYYLFITQYYTNV